MHFNHNLFCRNDGAAQIGLAEHDSVVKTAITAKGMEPRALPITPEKLLSTS
jgi:hypothetical protein